jgi:hypothetical protein
MGEPVLQVFLSDGASIVRTEAGDVCMVSQPIAIDQSRYVEADGTLVPFADIVRSHAASAQFIAAPSAGDLSLRIQLKYSPRPGTPMTMRMGGRVVDLAPMLEPSGDSFLVDDQALATIARAAIEAGMPLVVEATSRDTGRVVTDRVEGMEFGAFDDCVGGALPIDADNDPTPSDQIAIHAIVEQSRDAIATDLEASTCRFDDPTTTLYRGRLDRVTGFVSQTDQAFVTYDVDGSVDRLFIPGIVEGTTTGLGDMSTHVSMAANANVPGAAATVSGCIGPSTVMLCPEETPDGVVFRQCGDMLLAGDLFDDANFLVGDLIDPAALIDDRAASAPQRLAETRSGGLFLPGMPIVFGGGSSGGSGSSGGGDSGGGDPVASGVGGSDMPNPFPTETAPPITPAPIPLPSSAWLLLSSLGLLAYIRRKKVGDADDAGRPQAT